jgi:type IV secretory pathway VirB4 component
MRLPEHAATTANVAAIYPFMAGGGLPRRGVYVGEDRFGGGFVFSPFELYEARVVSGPNAAIFGRIGRGKSALVKSLLYRSVIFGTRGFVLDPKGEYRALAHALGLEVVYLRPDGEVRLNPLEAMVSGPEVASARVELQQLELLGALAETSLARRLESEERTAIELSLATVQRRTSGAAGQRTIPQVVEAMLRPEPGVGDEVGLRDDEVRRFGRQVALELRRLVTGDLRGMFDGPTSPGLPLHGEVVVLDLSGVYHSAALSLVMTCVMAWLRRLLEARAGHHHTYVVVDEAWVPLAQPAIARWLREGIKLARQYGTSWWLVLHKVGDLAAVGAAGSEQATVAQSLLEDLEIRIIYAQSQGEIARHGDLLGLTETEKELLPKLGQGRGLWKIGERSAVVQHRISPAEDALVDSDHAMHRTRYREDEGDVE